MAEQLPWETAERAYTLWQYDRGNPTRALEAAAALIRTTPGGTEALAALVATTSFAESAAVTGEDPVTALAATLARTLSGAKLSAADTSRWIPFTIECNECHRTQVGEVHADDPDTARGSFLDSVTAQGWVETKSRRHLCPKCAPTTPPETT